MFRDVMAMPTFLCVKARDAQHAVAVGTYGAIASTSDGQNWVWDQSPVNGPLYDIRVLPDGDYLIVGASGVVFAAVPPRPAGSLPRHRRKCSPGSRRQTSMRRDMVWLVVGTVSC